MNGAETHFGTALKANPRHPGASYGLAFVFIERYEVLRALPLLMVWGAQKKVMNNVLHYAAVVILIFVSDLSVKKVFAYFLLYVGLSLAMEYPAVRAVVRVCRAWVQAVVRVWVQGTWSSPGR